MAKIPVGTTIVRAWRFVIRDFFNILGVSAPVLVLSCLPSYLMYAQGSAYTFTAMNDPTRMAHLWPLLLPIYIAMFLFLAMQLIGIAELAAGTKRPPRWLYLSLDGRIWRLLGSILFLILVFLIGALLAGLGFGLLGVLIKLALGGNTANWSTALSGALFLVGSAVIWGGFLYCFVRLTFLLIPVIATRQPGFAVARGWALGAGNFWRMFALLLAAWLPLIALEFVGVFFMFRGLPFPPPHASPDQAAAFQAAMHARMGAMFEGAVAYWYVLLPVFFALMVLFYGFAVATQVFAHEALRSAPVTGDGLPD